MKVSSLPTSLYRLLPLVALSIGSTLTAAPKCDQMANDVRKAVSSDPAKTLMIVEDALVINESCACEIVRAAIEASGADEAMKQQIVQTALAVAPKMAPVISECAEMAGAGVLRTFRNKWLPVQGRWEGGGKLTCQRCGGGSGVRRRGSIRAI